MPMHVWPAFAQPPHSAARAAPWMSASASTRSASLPPSSSKTGVRVSAPAAMILRPVRAEPVKATSSPPAGPDAAPARQHTGERAQPVAALREVQAGPPLRRLAGALHGFAHLGLAVHGQRRDDLAGGRRNSLERLAARDLGAVSGHRHGHLLVRRL